MIFIKRTLVFISFCYMFLTSARPEQVSLLQAETLINALFVRMINTQQDEEKIILADSIDCQLELALLLPDAFEYPFESVKTMGKITSPDKRLRIFTWNLPLKNGTTRYYGFIQHKTDKTDKIQVFRLTDKSNDMDNPSWLTLTHSQWYGALIYEIIEKKYEGTNYYILLGYDPDNLFISRKIVDVLYFDINNEPLFGKPVFHYQNQMQYRIIFEYSSKVQMSLRWNPDLKMIIYDHLSPSSPANTGNFQFYGPDFSYDGLRFEKGIWEVVEDVDVRNRDKGQGTRDKGQVGFGHVYWVWQKSRTCSKSHNPLVTSHQSLVTSHVLNVIFSTTYMTN